MSSPHTRHAGVCLHITALPGPYGVGSLGQHARQFIDQLQASGVTLWQVLPTGPTGYGDSPYQLLSVFAGNPMLIDVEHLFELGLVTRAELGRLPEGSVHDVQFGEIVGPRRALLAIAARRFLAQAGAAAHGGFTGYCRAHDAVWLHDFARFSVLKSAHGERPWTEWPAEFASPDAATLAEVDRRFSLEIQSIKAQQYLFQIQWDRLRGYAQHRGVRLIGDAPIYVAHDSADTWARRDLFQFDSDQALRAVGGVPPDYFSADGQLWGNPLYDWPAHARDEFAWWRDRLARAEALTDILRIDHFRAFEAYWSVPAAATTARDGQWQTGPGDAFLHAVAEHLPDLSILAEDLGVITPQVQALRQRHGLPGMAVLQFLVDEPGFHPSHIEEDRACYTGTHDNDTTRGWFESGDRPEDDARRARTLAITQGKAASVAWDLFCTALYSQARFAIAPMQDLLNLPSNSRFNEPGTTENNWRWRLQPSDFDPTLQASLAAAVAASGR
ncbi:MAG: 4-alpha-glucanotransferase [Pseudomonadota bacterium]